MSKNLYVQLLILAVAVIAVIVFWPKVQSAPKSKVELQWYKGNTHTHSLWSDGNDFPEMIVEWYIERGYDFLVLSDHNVLSQGERWIDVERVRRRGG